MGTWETKASMSAGRNYLTSSVVDGKIYAIGGYLNGNLSKVECFDPSTDTWNPRTNMPTNRSALTSSAVNGKIYAIGGQGSSNVLNTVECYDPSTDTWTTKANMPTARNNLTSSVVNGEIYVIGGKSNTSRLNIVECYDPATDTWTTKANMPTARDNLTSSVVDGKIYAIGGTNGSNLSTVECYDPATNTWITKINMPTARTSLTSSVVDGKIYCIGGLTTEASKILECYDPTTNTWTTKADMIMGRSHFTASVVNGKIYAIGGYNNADLATVECYTPTSTVPLTGKWNTETPVTTARTGLATVTVNGKIYAIGGSNGSVLGTNERYSTGATPPTDVIKYLVVDGSNLKAWNGTTYVTVGTAPVTETLIKTSGSDTFSKDFSSLTTNTPKLLRYESASTSGTMVKYSVDPTNRKMKQVANYDVPVGIKDIAIAYEITGAATIKCIVSIDDGTTWKAFASGAWSDITEANIAQGMALSAMNLMTTENWDLLVTESIKKIKFMFYFDQGNLSSICKLGRIVINYKSGVSI